MSSLCSPHYSFPAPKTEAKLRAFLRHELLTYIFPTLRFTRDERSKRISVSDALDVFISLPNSRYRLCHTTNIFQSSFENFLCIFSLYGIWRYVCSFCVFSSRNIINTPTRLLWVLWTLSWWAHSDIVLGDRQEKLRKMFGATDICVLTYSPSGRFKDVHCLRATEV